MNSAPKSSGASPAAPLRATLGESIRLLRSIVRTLSHEDERRGGQRFAARATRATLVSALAGGLFGLVPSFVAIGIAGIATGAASLGPLAPLGRALKGAPSSVWVLTSLVLVSLAVSLGFVASRSAAAFSAEATASLRIAMMRRVLASSPRAIDAVATKITQPLAAKTPAPPPAAKPAGPAAAVRPNAGADAVKLSVLRDGQMASELVVATMSNLPQAVVGLVMLVVDVSVTGSALAAGLGVGVFLFSRIFASRASARVSAAMAELNRADALTFAEIGEKIGHLDDLRLAGARGAALAEVEGAVRATAGKRLLVARATAVSSQTASLISTLAPLVVLLSLSATGRTVSPPEIARLLLALPLIIARLGAVDALRIAAVEKYPVLFAVDAILDLAPHPVAKGGPVALDAIAASEIRFEHVRFVPEGQSRAILDDVSFTIPPGAIVGVCGPSGCGKSTLVRLLLRLDDPTSGRITVGGVDLGHVEPSALPRLFGALAQGGKLLPRSIRENVVLAREAQEAEDEARKAAEAALATAQIPELATSEGLERRFVAAPANLSGGEQRRVLLARALASDARVLVLDEPEAGLPRATARSLFEAVRDRLAGRPALVVTHAPSVLPSAFNVVLEAGKLVDQGPHAELLARCELYRTLAAEKISEP